MKLLTVSYRLIVLGVLLFLGLSSKAQTQVGISVTLNGNTYYIFQKGVSNPDTAKLRAVLLKRYGQQSVKKRSLNNFSGIGCAAISGETNVVAGQAYNYQLVCDVFSGGLYWIINCGYSPNGDPSGNLMGTIVWYGQCSNGSLEIVDENGQQMLFLSVQIQAPPPLTGGTLSAAYGTVFCAGQATGSLDGTPATGGTCGGYYDYQWQLSYDGSSWYDIGGATSGTYNPGTLSQSAYYRRKVSCAGDVAYSNHLYLQANYAPGTFSIQEQSSTSICPGGSVVLQTSISGNITWYRDGDIVGYGNSYTASTNGNYYAVNSNDCGSVQSSNTIYVTVVTAPSSPSISASKSLLCNGESATLSGSGSGTINWYNDQGTYVGSGGTITVTGAGGYYATASNSCGSSGASNTVYITTMSTPSAPVISAAASTLLCNGAGVLLTASGSNIVWSNGSAGNSITVYSGGTYYATASNSCGVSPASNSISTSVLSNPAQPGIISSKMNLCNGESATLSTGSSGSLNWYNGSGTYQGSGSSISVNQAGSYYVVAYNECGSTQSASITITTSVTPSAPVLVANAGTQICTGESGGGRLGFVPLSVQGGTGVVWSDGGSGNARNISQPGTYYVYSTNVCGTSPASNAITITAGAVPDPGQIIGATSACAGASVNLINYTSGGTWSSSNTGVASVSSTGVVQAYAAGTATIYYTVSTFCGTASTSVVFTVNGLPSQPSITPHTAVYCTSGTLQSSSSTGNQWYLNNSPIPGATGQTITVTQTGNYTVQVTNANGCVSAMSNTAPVTVYPIPSKPSITEPAGTTFCNTATLRSSSSSGNQWYLNGNPLDGAAGEYYTATQSGNYSVQVSGAGNCTSAMSEVKVISLITIPPSPSISASKTLLCNGESATLYANGSGTINWYNDQGTYVGSGGTITVTGAGGYYATASNSCGSSGASNTVYITTMSTPSAPVISAAASTLLCNGAGVLLTASGSNIVWSNGSAGNSITVYSGGTYYATASNSCGVSPASNSISTSVLSNPAQPSIISSKMNLCNGESATLSTGSSGSLNWYNGSGTYQGSGSSISVNQAGSYYVVAYNECGSTQSSSITITTSVTPSAPVLVANAGTQICSGDAGGGRLGFVPLSVQGGTGVIWSDGGAGNARNISQVGTYYVYSTNACGSSPASNSITVTAGATPDAGQIIGATSACAGKSVSLINYTSGGSWSSSNTGVASVSSTGVVQAHASGTATIYYTVSTFCGTASTSIMFTVNALPSQPSVTPNTAVYCSSGTLQSSSSTGNQWYLNNSPIPGATGQTITVTQTGNYTVQVTNANGCVSAMSTAAPITVYPVPATPVISSHSQTAVFCVSGQLTTPDQPGIQWYKDGEALPGANNAVLTVTASGIYQVRKTGDGGCTSALSAPVTVTVNALPDAGSINGPGSLCAGTQALLTNQASGGTWSSSNTSVATIDASTGQLNAIGEGAVQIMYTITHPTSGCTNTSSFAINIHPAANAGSIQGPASLKRNQQAVLFSSVPGGQWSSSNALVATIDNGTVRALTAGTSVISYTVTGTGNCSATATHLLRVYEPLDTPVISPRLSATDYNGDGETLAANSISGGETTQYQLQWYYSTDSIQWYPILQANAASYRPTGLTHTYYYRLQVTNASETVTSNTAVVSTPLVGGIIRASATDVLPGGVSMLLSVADATGGLGDYHYQWQYSADLQNWTNTTENVSNLQQTGWYRRQVNSGGLVAYSNHVIVRVTQDNTGTLTPRDSAQVQATQPLEAIPAMQGLPDNENRNFIKTRTIQKAGVTDSSAAALLEDPFDVMQSTTYFDGLGRPQQTVAKKATASAKDLVSINVYDAFGREALKFLPYSDGLTSGRFRTDAATAQPQFYAQQFNGSEQYYYSQQVFEPSPLNRVIKNMAPGKSFAGSGTGIHMLQRSNALYDSVYIWNIDAQGNLSRQGRYLPGRLYVEETVDEHYNHVVTYKDLDGQVILKKVQLSSALQPGHEGWLNTYYVYDDLGQLRKVLSPKAVEELKKTNWVLSASHSDELCFSYAYDERKRMVVKKVPGAGEVYMVYDKRDRLVFTQDANMRNQQKWMYTLYDGLNRPLETGMLNGYTGNREALQALVNDGNTDDTATHLITGTRPSTIPGDMVMLERTPGQTYYRATGSIVFGPGFSTEDGASFTAEIVASAAGDPFSSAVVTTGAVLPAGTSRTALTLTYYDDYTATGRSFTGSFATVLTGNHPNAEPAATQATALTKGMVTSTRVRVLENPANLEAGEWLETATFYDEKGRTIQSQSDNYKGGEDIQSMRYEFGGKLISTHQSHSNVKAGTVVQTLTGMQYDHAGRLLNVSKKIGEGATKTISTQLYDELGQLKQKTIGTKGIGQPLETLDYDYSIRGWLTGVNNHYNKTGEGNRWFGMSLHYDQGYQRKQLNGNIAGMRWRSKGDGEARSFGYAYDRVNRILKADFTQFTDNGWNTNAGLNFSMQMGNGVDAATAYDANGNILGMQQWGVKLNNSMLIDELQYHYFDGTNKLKSVIDLRNDTATRLGDFRSSKAYMTQLQNNKTIDAVDYAYDANGNMVKDLNKDITEAGAEGIKYNHLNLPYEIKVKDKGTITYIYDAAGNKLEKRTKENNDSTVTSYVGAYVYQQNKLQFFGQEEGRVRVEIDSNTLKPQYVYDYFVKDHLGNTRMVLTEEHQRQIYPAATLETSAIETEKLYYQINPAAVVPKPVSLNADYPNNNGILNPGNKNAAANSTSMYKLNAATGDKMGLGIMLKVMSGDTVSIFGKSFWHNNAQTNPNHSYQIPLNDLLLSLLNVSKVVNFKGITIDVLNNQPITTELLQGLLNKVPQNGTAPKAYINWILLDEQLKPVENNSSFDPVESQPEIVKTHTRAVNINRNGYLYVYVSNQSNLDVFFDNLQLVHSRGPLLEETHYSSWGNTLTAISSKAAGKMENRYKFNGSSESNTDLELNWYETDFRNYDPQIGRFHQIDFLSSLSFNQSPFAFVHNNPVNYIDPLGLDTLKLINGQLPTSRPDGAALAENDVILDESGSVAQTYNGQGWQATAELQEVVVSSSRAKPIASASSISPETPMQPVRINFERNANRKAVTQHTINVLSEIMRESGNPSLTITSTQRSPEDQARAMYNNIVSRGVQYNLNLYSANGDRVVNVAARGRQGGLTRDEILANMAAEIRRIGPTRVSRHAGDPTVLNVIDISPGSLRNRRAFVKEVRERGIFLLQPPADPAYHLEIRQQ